MRRVMDVSKLAGLVEASQTQVVQKGSSKTTDPNFPVFTTPVNEDILVYIPMTNVVNGENGPDMKVLQAYLHDYTNGALYGSLRCINGMAGNELYDELGYDGTCPICDATRECWSLYRTKLNAEAARMGIDAQNDPTDLLKPTRDNLLRERAVKDAEEYVTFPIVIIPTSAKLQPTEDALQNLKPVFVTWKKKRYDEAIISALDAMVNNPGHPAGLFWQWKFTYNTGGKQANARDSAKNAKYLVIKDEAWEASMKAVKDAAELAAEQFTLVKAAEVIKANQFLYKEDILAEIKPIMAATRQQNELAEMSSTGTQPAIAAPTNPATNPLSGFNGVAPQGNLGVSNEKFEG